MDFTYSEEQEAVRELAGRIFTERATHERLKALEAAAGEGGPFDAELWGELAEAGLIGIALDEDHGGAGLDFVAACLVIEAAGRTAAYVPVVETMVYGAATIERFGTDAQKAAWLPGVISGETILTAALAELVGELVLPGGPSPETTAVAGADGTYVLPRHQSVCTGCLRGPSRVGARHHHRHRRFAAGCGVFIVDTGADAVTLAPAGHDHRAHRGDHRARCGERSGRAAPRGPGR